MKLITANGKADTQFAVYSSCIINSGSSLQVQIRLCLVQNYISCWAGKMKLVAITMQMKQENSTREKNF